MNKYTGQARLALLVFFLLFTGCQSITVEGGYTPPGIPVRVSIDSNGQLKFTAESNVELPTPLGTFDVGLVIEPIVYFGVENALTVRYNGQDHFYNLHGQDFNITFESGCYKDIKFSKTNNNLFLELARSCDGNDNIQSSYQISFKFNDLANNAETNRNDMFIELTIDGHKTVKFNAFDGYEMQLDSGLHSWKAFYGFSVAAGGGYWWTILGEGEFDLQSNKTYWFELAYKENFWSPTRDSILILKEE